MSKNTSAEIDDSPLSALEDHGEFIMRHIGPRDEQIEVMLKEVGCSHVILGHSERRQLCRETDELVGIKVRAAHRDGLIPIICVGETLEQRDRGETITVVDRQIRAALY